MNPGAKKRVTFDLDPELHRRAKMAAASEGLSLVKWVSKLMDEAVEKTQREAREAFDRLYA